MATSTHGHDPATSAHLVLLLSQEHLAQGIQRLARHIREDYQGCNPLLVGVLKGAFIFLADLVRALHIPLEIDFVRVATYGAATHPSAPARVLSGVRLSPRGRHVLVVEDIVDTGFTTQAVLTYLKRFSPLTLRTCVLLDKPSCRRVEVPIHYLGFTLPDRFVVGYGLDKGEAYRWLPAIYALEEGDHEPAAPHRRGTG
ncbi:MAG: hypoxanthine phosphoribosyltransferase [Dehalococcoidia bacterium]|nr:hypoxanthine phosphoribosyltransferase [Dehalococcoidia bacterium]MDW8119376.1 hypoxanthine phosphoribosyltransferase [Chloroflexota bacterium]